MGNNNHVANGPICGWDLDAEWEVIEDPEFWYVAARGAEDGTCVVRLLDETTARRICFEHNAVILLRAAGVKLGEEATDVGSS